MSSLEIRDFCDRIGIAKADNLVDVAHLEHCVREDLNKRLMAVLRPRKVLFSRILYIEQDDFRDPPPPKYFRLFPGAEVRLRYAYIVKCTGVERDASGQVVTVRCTYDPASRGGDAKGRKVKGTIHWVSAAHAFKTVLNRDSLEVLTRAKLEPALPGVAPESCFQFERQGYFVADWTDHSTALRVFNRTVGLRDTWAKIETAGA